MDIKKISIKNFRVFKEKNTFQLRPFTILTGPNNSGKSSFTKFLLLLKEGLSTLNFTSGNHNLNDYKSSLNWEKSNENLYFEVVFENNIKICYSYFLDGFLNEIKYFRDEVLVFDFSRNLKLKDNFEEYPFENFEDKTCYTSQFINLNYLINEKLKSKTEKNQFKKLLSLELDEAELNFQIKTYNEGILFDVFDKDENITLDHIDLIKDIQNKVFNSFNTTLPKFRLSSNFYEVLNLVMDLYLTDIVFKFKYELNKIPFFNSIDFDVEKSNFCNFLLQPTSLNKIHENDHFRYILGPFYDLSRYESDFKKLSYLSPNRGNQKRVLMNYSDKDIDSIIVNFSKRKNIQLDFLSECFKILEIEGQLEVNRYENTISTVRLLQKGKKLALADLGFGYSQIIPIILKVHNFLPDNEVSIFKNHRRNQNLKELYFGTLILEEPEANLHPNLQSKLAELLVYIQNTYKINFIIETHSEYFIRKLQYLTAKEELKTEDSVIYYFNDDKYVSKTEPKVKEIFINEDGGLTDSFGPGFFDEATKLQFDLIRLQKQQFN